MIAVCLGEVVAPPINNGIVNPCRSISFATFSISSREGVIKPLKHIASTFSFFAVFNIFSHGTITPRSIISKLLQAKTTLTIFLPMSCTSPFTVASRILPGAFLTEELLALI